MAINYGGFLDGILRAEAANKDDEDRRTDLERYNKDQERADKLWTMQEEKFAWDKKVAAENSVYKFLNEYSSKNNGRGSVETNVELTNTLKAVQGMLPENSSVAAELVNAPIESLQEALTIIQTAKKQHEENGQVWSPEISESLFENLYITTVENKDAFDPIVLAENAGINYDGNTIGGVPWKDVFNQYLRSPTSTAVIFDERTPVEPLDLAKQAQLQSTYRKNLEGPLGDMKAEFNSKLAAGEPVDINLVRKVDEALANLKGDNPSTRLAVQLVGPQVAIELLRLNPNAQSYSTYINKGLVFSDDDAGAELLAQSIRVGLLKEGDYITVGYKFLPVTSETVRRAQEN